MSSEDKQLRHAVDNILRWSRKIYRFRKDILSESQRKGLERIQEQFLAFQKNWRKQDPAPLGLMEAVAEAEKHLKTCGRPFFPINFWSDNAEVIWVAAFVALSFRTFFCQPFRIPTCSMFPSFSGMLTRVNADDKAAPNFFVKPLRWLITGASNYRYMAPCDGQIQIPLFRPDEMREFRSRVRYEVEEGREIGGLWIKHFFPKPYHVYILWVKDQQIRIRVPAEFTDIEAIFHKKFFSNWDSFEAILQSESLDISYTSQKGYCINTHCYVKRGEPCLNFDILDGDMVFVDRITYHFRRPRVGEAFVFRTGTIPKLETDIYYIKRLAGAPGDVLSIHRNKLYRNGALVSGSMAFENNNARRGIYPGYRSHGLLAEGQHYTVTDGHFFALGDNSPFSYDSRFWGEVPEKAVIGKALFVLHPCSWRWGRAEQDKSNMKASPQDYVFK